MRGRALGDALRQEKRGGGYELGFEYIPPHHFTSEAIEDLWVPSDLYLHTPGIVQQLQRWWAASDNQGIHGIPFREIETGGGLWVALLPSRM